jgi:Protein of unknown function (DUF2281)
MINFSQSIAELIRQLPDHAQLEIKDFTEFLLKRYNFTKTSRAIQLPPPVKPNKSINIEDVIALIREGREQL